MRTIYCLLLCVTTVHGWGRVGHEITANVAWHFLSQKTQAQIMSILKVTSSSKTITTTTTSSYYYYYDNNCDDCSPLGEISDWADAVRHYYPWSSPLHYIDVRDDLIRGGCSADSKNENSVDCRFEYDRDCLDDVCVAGSIVNYTSIVSDYANVDHPQDLFEPLKFLTHFVGDIHQPLHASRTTDRGGNSIHVKFHDTTAAAAAAAAVRRNLRSHRPHHANNLHAVWDDSLLEKCLRDDFADSRVDFEAFLIDWLTQNPGYARAWLKCPDGANVECTTIWGQESFDTAIQWAYRNFDGTEIVDGTELSIDYYQTRLPVVKQRLLAGGLRLAATLEIAFSGATDVDGMLVEFLG